MDKDAYFKRALKEYLDILYIYNDCGEEQKKQSSINRCEGYINKSKTLEEKNFYKDVMLLIKLGVNGDYYEPDFNKIKNILLSNEIEKLCKKINNKPLSNNELKKLILNFLNDNYLDHSFVD